MGHGAQWEVHFLPASHWWPTFQWDGDSLKFHLVVLKSSKGKGVEGARLSRKRFQRRQTPLETVFKHLVWRPGKLGTNRNRQRWIESHSCQAGNVQEPYKYFKLKRATLEGKECRVGQRQTENKWSMKQSKSTSQGTPEQTRKPLQVPQVRKPENAEVPGDRKRWEGKSVSYWLSLPCRRL